LVIFKIPASSYWWVRYYAESHIFKRTTKTEVKRDALEAAKRFFDDICIRLRGGNFEGLPIEVNVAEVITFAKVTKMLLESEVSKLNRSQLSKISYDNMHLRYDKHILPFFGQADIQSINYKVLDEFLQKLSNLTPKLSVSTLGAYMRLTRKVLQHAARHSFIQHIPEFPKVGIEDKPRGWFNVGEYKAITKISKKLSGKKVEWRAHSDSSKGSYFCQPSEALLPTDRLIKRIDMTKDLSDLIVFMVNSYIRPTDIRNMQHKHVEIVHREWTYLRLSLPPSKGHTFPITTMPWAVKVYERICRRQTIELGRDIQPEDYVFLPKAASRDNAMKLLARQFEIVLEVTGLKLSTAGETRSLYSLRHSSIMFRLMFGRGVDTLTLARNARTSPEMIDRFYAAPLQGEMNVGELQSKRRPRPWE
jgi:NADH/NAD ratio-sensing transcriptional regulator Rex